MHSEDTDQEPTVDSGWIDAEGVADPNTFEPIFNDEAEQPTCAETEGEKGKNCLLYTSPSPRDATLSRMPSSA